MCRSGLVEPGALGEPHDIQNQGDPAIAHDGRTGIGRQALELATQWLDDNLLRVEHRVDEQSKLAIVGLQDDDVRVAFLGRLGELQHLTEVDECEQVSAQPEQGYPVNSLDRALALVRVEPYEFHQVDLGNREALPPGPRPRGLARWPA